MDIHIRTCMYSLLPHLTIVHLYKQLTVIRMVSLLVTGNDTHTHTFAASFAFIIFSLDFSSRSSSNCLRSILNQSINLLIQVNSQSPTHPPKSLPPTRTFHSHLFPFCIRQTLPATPAVPPSPPQVETWVQRAGLGRWSSPRTQQATGERLHSCASLCGRAQRHSFLTNGSGVDWATISLYMSRCLTTASTCACTEVRNRPTAGKKFLMKAYKERPQCMNESFTNYHLCLALSGFL